MWLLSMYLVLRSTFFQMSCRYMFICIHTNIEVLPFIFVHDSLCCLLIVFLLQDAKLVGIGADTVFRSEKLAMNLFLRKVGLCTPIFCLLHNEYECVMRTNNIFSLPMEMSTLNIVSTSEWFVFYITRGSISLINFLLQSIASCAKIAAISLSH